MRNNCNFLVWCDAGYYFFTGWSWYICFVQDSVAIVHYRSTRWLPQQRAVREVKILTKNTKTVDSVSAL